MKRVLVAMVSTLLLAACTSAANHSALVTTPTLKPDEAAPAAYGGTQLNASVPNSILSLKFFNQENHSFTLRDYAGKTVVITNFLTHCQDAGPLIATNFLAISKSVEKSSLSDDVVFMLITVDAARDSAERLKAYGEVFGFPGNVILASASPESLESLWKYFGVPSAFHELSPDEIATFPNDWQTGLAPSRHYMYTNMVSVIDANSTWRWVQTGHPEIENNPMPKRMMDFLSPDGRGLLNKKDDFGWRVIQVKLAIADVTGVEIPK